MYLFECVFSNTFTISHILVAHLGDPFRPHGPPVPATMTDGTRVMTKVSIIFIIPEFIAVVRARDWRYGNKGEHNCCTEYFVLK